MTRLPSSIWPPSPKSPSSDPRDDSFVHASTGRFPECSKSRPISAPSFTVPLTDAPQHVCVTANGPAGEVNVRLRQCANETCTGPSDTVPRTHTATIDDGIYAGKTTNVRLGAFRIDANTPVPRCEVRGCTDRFADSFCRLEDGAHFCEFQSDVAPRVEGCDVSATLDF